MARSTSTAVTTQKGGAVTTTRKGGEVTAISRTAVDKAVLESISNLLSGAKELYAPEGGFMAGIEAQLGRGRTRAIAGGMQGLAAAGLAGTSMAGGLARKYEEEVAAPTMAQATTQRLTALAGLMQTEAGFQAQLAPRETTQKTTTSPLITEQITAPSTAIQRTSSWASTPIAPPAPAIRPPPSALTQQAQPTQARQPAQPAQPTQQPLPPNPIAKSYAPAGQWQATIGGTSYYATGTGGFTQKQTPAPKKSLSSYYDVGGELGI